ncbi:PHP domain-containing protein [Bacillaceae bacterium Marseille-Q3522]|nr:PHP domain-containing protein [Bacillaceae bacterium Marseille-Q3522]
MKIDLHCHTSISDNSFSTEEVILQAKQEGVTHLAITDHDTTIGLPAAVELGKEQGVEIIPGIEISAFDYKRNRRAHILGLFVTPGHAAIDTLCRPLIEKRHAACYQMVQKIQEASYKISWEEVERLAAGGTGVYKQHIMHILLNNGYTDQIYGELYRKLFSRGINGAAKGIAYQAIKYLDAYDAIKAIREADGIPVLAHPGQFNNFEAVAEWVQAGLKGIEVHHPLHTKADEEKAMELARQYQLLQTGGSDFHGFYSDTNSKLGSKTTEPQQFLKLKEEKYLWQNS